MRIYVLVVAVSLLLLGGCSGPKNKLEKCHKAQEYQTAKVGPRVRVPEDLVVLEPESRLEIPFGPTKTEPTPKGEPCLIEPPEYVDRSAN
jgi:uncharacterized lipoprotein